MSHRAAILVLWLTGGCGKDREFHCEQDSQCILDNAPGRCEVNGFCSFGDIRCASGARYGEHAPHDIRDQCVTQPSNATCEQAPLVGEETTTGTLRGATSSGVLTCSPASTSEVFYSVELADCSDLQVTAVGEGNLSLGLLSDCTELLGCVDASATNAGEALDVVGLPAGAYQIAVAGASYDDAYTLTTELAAPPLHDRCVDAISATGALGVQTLARAADDLVLPGRTGARDLFYSLSLATRSVIEIDATPTAPLTGLDVALLDDACSLIATSPAGSGPVRFGDLVPGNYRLAIDGPPDGSCGHFDMTVSTKTVADHNQCAGAKPLLFNVSASIATAIVDLGPATDDYQGSCGGTGSDVVYSFTLAKRSRVHISAISRTGAFRPVVYVRQTGGDCAAAAEVTYDTEAMCIVPPDPRGPVATACVAASAGSAQLEIVELDAGTYQLVVDSEDGAGTLDLELTVVAPYGDISPGVFAGGSTFFDDLYACETASTVGGTESAMPACFPPSVIKPSVLRSITIPAGCARQNGAFTLSAYTPHDLTIEAINCAQSYPAWCAAAPLTPNVSGLYVTTLVGVIPDTPCELRIGIYAASGAAMTDQFQLTYRYGNITEECTGP